VVIGATDGRYHALDLPGFSADDPGVVALSPDGYHLAWSTQERVDSVDLRTGEVVGLVPHGGHGADVTELAWTYDSARITYQGTFDGQAVAGSIEPAGPSEVDIPVERTLATGLSSPTRGIVALATGSDRTFARFERVARPAEQAQKDLRSDEGVPLRRQLPPDLYPDGASTRPLGWATGSLVVAQADGPAGSYVEGQHLVLFTSPDRPESEWTFRILVRDLPDATPVSIAVDLVPDLDGTSSQQLTHDFASHDAGLPAGVRWGGTALAGLGVLLAAYLLRRREQRRPGRLTA
jgi:hypothetical protein